MLNAERRQTLAAIRSLGQQGIPVLSECLNEREQAEKDINYWIRMPALREPGRRLVESHVQ